MKRIKSVVMAALVVLVAATSILPTASASAVANTGTSSALSIVPKKTYVLKPGQSVDDTLQVTDLDNSAPLNLSLSVIDFTFTDTSGTPKLFLSSDAPQTTWSLRSFMSVPQAESIKPGATASIPMHISIPSNLGAGSYYSAIVYSTGAPNGGNVGLSASGVTLVFVTVPGKVNENLTLQKFGAYLVPPQVKTAGYTYISTQAPQSIAYDLKNTGNVFESPAGSVTLKWMFGKTQTIGDINPAGSLALIGQTRTFTACIKQQTQNVNLAGTNTQANTCADPGLWPGLYTMSINVYYGQNGNVTQEVVGTSYFWYLPLWFIITAIVVLLLIAYFVWRITLTVRRWMGIQPAPKKPKASRSFRRK